VRLADYRVPAPKGRYHDYRLHPFSMAEINAEANTRERLQRVIYDDIRDLENIKEISLLELLAGELPNRVGSPLSIKNLKERLQVARESVERWIQIFERMYFCFRVPPYGSRNIRAVKKEQKLYLWDWSAVPEEGPRFENFIASHLLKYCHFVEDTEGYKMGLRFLRDTDKREMDFVVLEEGKPLFAVECKSGEKNINPSLFYLRDRRLTNKGCKVSAQSVAFARVPLGSASPRVLY